MDRVLEISEFCKGFRRQILNLTLQEMEEKTGVKFSTLSAFENGRSKNLSHVLKYVEVADEDQKAFFISGFNRILRGAPNV